MDKDLQYLRFSKSQKLIFVTSLWNNAYLYASSPNEYVRDIFLQMLKKMNVIVVQKIGLTSHFLVMWLFLIFEPLL